MPFYANEDLDKWMKSVFMEEYEDLDDQMELYQVEELNDTLKSLHRFNDYCYDKISNMVSNENLISAILNTFHYEHMMEELQEWVDKNDWNYDEYVEKKEQK
jgi:hypothetical protein